MLGFKRFIMATAFCVLLPFNAMAEWDWNVLLGASAGFANRHGTWITDLNYSNPVIVPPGFFRNAVHTKITDEGLIWGGLGGVQAFCGPYTLGIEFSVTKPDYDEQHHYAFADSQNLIGWNGAARYDQGMIYALSLRGGYQLLDWLMGYVRIGVETSKDELQASFIPNTAVYPFSYAFSKSKHSLRFLGGVGLEVPLLLLEGLVLRAEYNYHANGRKIDMTAGFVETPTFGIDPVFGLETKQRTHAGLASIVYNFL